LLKAENILANEIEIGDFITDPEFLNPIIITNKITNLNDPENNDQAATKNYVDGFQINSPLNSI
jgi:hypothetical protein